MFNTLTVRTWDLMIPRPSWVLVTNPDRQLPCHFSKTVLRIPSKRAKVFFLPSYSEAMPMSILEAMGYGLPVVASNVGGIPSIVRNNINGFTFIPGDVEGMAAAIIEILKNSKLANKLSENSAKIIAEEYSLKSHIDAVEKLYEVQA